MHRSTEGISSGQCHRLREQGFTGYSDAKLAELAPGIRFAYALCTTLVLIGTLLRSVPVLALTAVVAIGGTVPPNHPFDHLYNYGVRHLLGRPPVPARPPQSRFACGVAALWLGAMIYVLIAGLTTVFYLLATGLIAVGTLVSVYDKCLPSVVYNAIFEQT